MDSNGPGELYGEVSADWTPDAPAALVLFHGYGANEQDLVPLGPLLAPALPWAALRALLRVAPGGYAWFPLTALGDRDPARVTDAVWQWIDAHLTPDAKVAAVGFSQGGLMATQLLRTRPERVAATVVLSGFVQATAQPADEQLAADRELAVHEPRFGEGDHGVLALVAELDTRLEALAAAGEVPRVGDVEIGLRDLDEADEAVDGAEARAEV